MRPGLPSGLGVTKSGISGVRVMQLDQTATLQWLDSVGLLTFGSQESLRTPDDDLFGDYWSTHVTLIASNKANGATV